MEVPLKNWGPKYKDNHLKSRKWIEKIFRQHRRQQGNFGSGDSKLEDSDLESESERESERVSGSRNERDSDNEGEHELEGGEMDEDSEIDSMKDFDCDGYNLNYYRSLEYAGPIYALHLRR